MIKSQFNKEKINGQSKINGYSIISNHALFQTLLTKLSMTVANT